MPRNLKKPKADIGIFGGSGLYSALLKTQKVEIATPFGKPSDKITLGEYARRKVAFLPRHGAKHQFPPHRIPFRANLWALKKLGVKQIIAPCASGSLTPRIKPGDFVICDQFFDRTSNRKDTFFPGPKVAHIGMAQPYCPTLRKLAIESCQELNIPAHHKGTVVVIQGPRFSTRAESQFFQAQGWSVINMTAYPEVVLARELQICYLNIILVTDYDTGLEGCQDIKPVTATEVLRVFRKNNQKVKKVILKMIEKIPKKRNCSCAQILNDSWI